MRELKEIGIWIVGADEGASADLYTAKPGPSPGCSVLKGRGCAAYARALRRARANTNDWDGREPECIRGKRRMFK